MTALDPDPPPLTAGPPALRIGRLALGSPVVLAPMAGVTDAPFRVLCAEHGGGLYVSEMVTARGLTEDDPHSWRMARHHPAERVRSLQLYGADPKAMGEAVARLVDGDVVDHLDINVGCPVPKITRNGGGAALPVKRRLFGAVVAAAVHAAGDVPVTVKMRMGIDDKRLTYLEAGRIAADSGAAAVALHARTAAQGYAGRARWEAIGRLKDALGDLPVLGNGDIWAAEDALAMVRETGCDGVVVGRGCLGRPWLFADLERAFSGQLPLGPPRLGELAGSIRRHLELAVDWFGEDQAVVRRLRKHFKWYLTGYAVGSAARTVAGTAETSAAVLAMLDGLDPDIPCEPEMVRAPRGKTAPQRKVVLPHGWCDDPDAMPGVDDPLMAVSGG